MKQSMCTPVLVVQYPLSGPREYDPSKIKVSQAADLMAEFGGHPMKIEYRSHIQCASCLAPAGEWCRPDCEQLPRFAHMLTGKRLH